MHGFGKQDLFLIFVFLSSTKSKDHGQSALGVNIQQLAATLAYLVAKALIFFFSPYFSSTPENLPRF